MKIAFWSNAHEQSNVSLNLAAISVASVIRYPYTIAVLENELRRNNLGGAYLGTNKSIFFREIGTNYYEGGGMEGLLRRIYRGNLESIIMKYYLMEIIQSHLYYLPQSDIINREIFDYEFDHNSAALFDMLEAEVDICYIDTAPYNNLSSKTILEEADLIVVNLSQNVKLLENFFQSYSSLISKSVFVISNYMANASLSCRMIANKYDIPLDIITPISRSELFLEACSEGRAIEFIISNYMCQNGNSNYPFIQSVKKATSMIMKGVEISKESVT